MIRIDSGVDNRDDHCGVLGGRRLIDRIKIEIGAGDAAYSHKRVVEITCPAQNGEKLLTRVA